MVVFTQLQGVSIDSNRCQSLSIVAFYGGHVGTAHPAVMSGQFISCHAMSCWKNAKAYKWKCMVMVSVMRPAMDRYLYMLLVVRLGLPDWSVYP